LSTSAAPEQIAPDPRRALDALDRAVACTFQGAPDRPLQMVHRDDFRVASASMIADLRGRFDQVLMGPDAEAGLDALLTCGALDVLLPEVKALVGFGDGEWRHKDVWKHTKQVVRQAEARLEVRWSALLHDIGKVRTRSISPDGEVHFFGHAEVGARMFDKLDRRTRFFAAEGPLRETVRFLILHHLRAAGYDASWTDSAVRRFGKEMGPHLDALLCLSRADITTKRPEKKRKGLRQIDELNDRLQQIQTEDAEVPPLPKGIGDAIMVHFGLSPSRIVGDTKRALEGEIEAGALQPHQPVEFYVDYLASNAARFGLAKG
jgi:poly(A) polymerase